MGIGLLISGVAATVAGTMAIASGAVALRPDVGPVDGSGSGTEEISSDGPQPGFGEGLGGIALALGVLASSAGLIMIPVGAVRLHRWRAWNPVHPTVNRSAPGTWIAGVTLRF
jgi:hypothetical protein